MKKKNKLPTVLPLVQTRTPTSATAASKACIDAPIRQYSRNDSSERGGQSNGDEMECDGEENTTPHSVMQKNDSSDVDYDGDQRESNSEDD